MYNIEPHNEYVVVGNDVLLKCNIPSFVADFVSVVAWVDSESTSYYPSNDNGNFLGLRGTECIPNVRYFLLVSYINSHNFSCDPSI